jgi:hypothetical protein
VMTKRGLGPSAGNGPCRPLPEIQDLLDGFLAEPDRDEESRRRPSFRSEEPLGTGCRAISAATAAVTASPAAACSFRATPENAVAVSPSGGFGAPLTLAKH